jgi:hypothetical protein
MLVERYLKSGSGRAADRRIVDAGAYFMIGSPYFRFGESRCDPSDCRAASARLENPVGVSSLLQRE